MQLQKISSLFNWLFTIGAAVAFLGLWLSMGATFAGIVIGVIVGWASGTIVGANTYSTALVGAAGGAIIGIISLLIVGVGIIVSKKEAEIFGWKLSKVLPIGILGEILFLFVMTIVTIPVHSFFLNEYIVPFLLPPPYVPDKQALFAATKYEQLPTLDRDTSASSFYKAIPTSSFTEINVFKDICAWSPAKEHPIALIDKTVFIAGTLETNGCEGGISLISADVMTGKVNWQAVVGSPFIDADAERLYAEFPRGSNAGITAFNINSGDVVWQTPFPSWVAIGVEYLEITGDTLSVKTYHRHRGAFYVLNRATGEIQISKNKDDLEKEDFTFMIDEGVTYEWFGHSMTASGKNEWITEFGPNQHFFDRELAAPVVTDDLILVRKKYPTYNPITAVNRQNGSVVWQIRDTAVSNLAVDGPITYFVTKNAELMAIETQTGRALDSLKFTPTFGERFDFLNNAIVIATHSNTIVVYFEDKWQLSIFHFEGSIP